jgi:hypothetical protein
MAISQWLHGVSGSVIVYLETTGVGFSLSLWSPFKDFTTETPQLIRALLESHI